MSLWDPDSSVLYVHPLKITFGAHHQHSLGTEVEKRRKGRRNNIRTVCFLNCLENPGQLLLNLVQQYKIGEMGSEYLNFSEAH